MRGFMAKILACCANGSGTSLMMQLTLDKVISTCGFHVEEATHDSITEGRKRASQYDIVLCPMSFVDLFADAADRGILLARNHDSRQPPAPLRDRCGTP